MIKKIMLFSLLVINLNNAYAQDNYIDTVFTTCFMNECSEGLNIPTRVREYLRDYESSISIETMYEGECNVGEIKYDCLKFYKAIVKIRIPTKTKKQ